MQLATLQYTDEQIAEAQAQPSLEDVIKEAKQDTKDRTKFFEQLFFLAASKTDKNEKKHEMVNLARLFRLLNLNHNIMGQRAVNLIKQGIAYWQRNIDDAKDDRLASGGIAGYQPHVVDLQKRTFAQHMDDEGWSIVPLQCQV